MIKDYQIIEKIGKGTFGIVYKVKRLNDPLIYVIKQISLNGLNEEQKNQVHSEARILSLIKSNYVVKYYESFLLNNDLNIVMDYCDNGDLCHYLSKQKNPLKEELIWQIFIKITIGLTAIHKMKILHRDLKTLNIFLKKDMEIKIGDLGVAKELNQASFANTLIGTPYYLSPEMCEDKPYNQKSDVWALGCILYELCTYRHPFNASNHGALILKILNNNPDPILAIYSSKLQKLVNEILEKNYEKRPNCWDILNKTVVVEKAKKFGLYQEILNVFSNNNYIIGNKNRYNNIPLDSEDILLKSQLTAPNNNDNKVHVRKLNKDEKKVLKDNQINKRTSISSDKKLKKNNENQNYYINNLNVNGFNKNQNGVQYSPNLVNNIDYNNYMRNSEFRINDLNNNNIGLLNGNYFISTNTFNNLYNNINQNNNDIYNEIIINNNNTLNYKEMPSFMEENNEPMKCARVTRIYNNQHQSMPQSQPLPQPQPSQNQNQIFNQINYNKTSFGKTSIDINESLNSLNISLKAPPIDMDRDNDKILGSSVNSIDIKKDSEDGFYRYPLNSDMPMDNCNEDIPLDNIKRAKNNLPLEIVSNEKNLQINNEELNKNEIDKQSNSEVNKSSTRDNSLMIQPFPEIDIINDTTNKKDLTKNNKDIFVNNASDNNLINPNINSRYHKKSFTKKNNMNSKNNSNHKLQNKKFNLENMLYKKNTNDKIKTNPLGEILNSDNKLNKTSINLTSSDNFNINIDYQEPIPLDMQLKQFNINSGEIVSESILKNNDTIINDIEDIKKDEQEIPKLDDIDQDNQIIQQKKNNIYENKLKKIKKEINLLVGEKDYKNLMKLYSKDNNKDNIYVEIEKYIDNNNFNKQKKEKFFDLYLSLVSIDSQNNQNKEN